MAQPPPPLHPAIERFGYWVFRLHRAMYAQFGARLSELGITGVQWTMLNNISRADLTPVAISDLMSIDRAAVTRILQQLEAKGLVKRKSHPTDGRSTFFTLSPAGKKLVPKLQAAAHETNQQFLAHLPPDEAELLPQLLFKLVQSLPPQTFPLPEGPPSPSPQPRKRSTLRSKPS